MIYPCPCCGYFTYDHVPDGSFDVCPVCFWEDDNVQNVEPSYEGGANGISLNNARKNFLKFGAIKKEFIDSVRKPLPDEIR